MTHFQQPNEIHISRKNIIQNIALIRKIQPNAEFFPVLKGNAYGHGLKEVLEIIQWEKFPYILVNNSEEYNTVMNHSDFHVLFLSETLLENYQFFDFERTAFAIYNTKTLEHLGKMDKKIRVHIFLNTGMNREGIQEDKIPEIIKIFQKYPKLTFDGTMSHFYTADVGSRREENETQIKKFKKMYQIFVDSGLSAQWRHIGASAGITILNDDFFNAFRPGGIIFGYNPVDYEIPWVTDKPQTVLSIESTIIALQKVKKWEIVGYSGDFIAHEDCIVATVPFGYFEWFHRSFKGKMTFFHNEKPCQQVGVISMNMTNCIVDETAKIGDTIELVSEKTEKPNSIVNISSNANLLLDAFLVGLHPNIPRIIK